MGYINLLKPSGFFTYHQGLTFKNSTWRSLRVECFVRISEQTATFALYIIDWLVFITVVESVYCAVRADSLYKADYVSSLKGYVKIFRIIRKHRQRWIDSVRECRLGNDTHDCGLLRAYDRGFILDEEKEVILVQLHA